MIRITVFTITIGCLFFFTCCEEKRSDKIAEKHIPSDHFYLQRSYPSTDIPYKAYEKALIQTKKAMEAGSQRNSSPSWQIEGPTNIGGRINTIAVDPQNPNKILVGCAAGGIFLTADGGNSWIPVFDSQLYLAVSDIEFHPQNSNIIYAGTGDVNISGFPFIGNGIYRSTDGGYSWHHRGLSETRVISRIKVNPHDPSTIYVATMGLPFERNNFRGIYKSTNGGANWNQVLFISDSTGISDMVLHPDHPDTIFCTGWDRIRNNTESLISGKGGRVYRSNDGGDSWMNVSPSQFQNSMSRCGLDIDFDGNLVVHGLADNLNTYGIFTSSNNGDSWTMWDQASLPDNMGGFGWYFGKVKINPYKPNEIYSLGVELYRSDDFGNSWSMKAPGWWTYDVHADKHDLVFVDSSTLLLATDGGLYRSTDNGMNWNDIENIPNTQFYRVAVNPHKNKEYWGGAQDNGSTKGNSNNPNAWPRIFGGDGFTVAFNPADEDVVYCETQNGSIVVSLNGGNNFLSASSGLGNANNERRNWDMPYIISQHNPNVMYAGTYRVHKSTNSTNNVHFSPISPDLTDGLILHSRYHTITTLNESAIDSNLLLAGTVDANLWITIDGGLNWNEIHSGLPGYYVTDVKSSKVNYKKIFTTNSGYKDNVFISHVHMSDDLGKTWKSISAGLPNLAVNHLEVSYYDDGVLFVATDGGVYYSKTGGNKWRRLGNNMPVIPIYDLDIDYKFRKLIAGTHARSIMSISVDTILTDTNHISAKVKGDTVLCKGEKVKLFATGGQFYRWYNKNGDLVSTHPVLTDNPNSGERYSLIVQNVFGKADTINVRIRYVKSPTPSLVLEKDSIFLDGEFDQINWFIDGELVSTSSQSEIKAISAGYYHAEVGSGNCWCSSTRLNITSEDISNFDVFPTPANNLISIKSKQDVKSIMIYDAAGKLLISRYGISENIETSTFPDGQYIIVVETSSEMIVKKLIITH